VRAGFLKNCGSRMKKLSDNVTTLLPQATSFLREHRYAEARRVCLKLLAKHPDLVDALRVLQVAEDGLGNTTRALQLLRRLRQLLPYDVEIAATLGAALEKAGQYTDAIEAFQQAAQIDPLTPSLGNLERLYAKINPAAGLEYFKALHLRCPSLIMPLVHLSLLHAAFGSLLEAKEYADKALSFDPCSWAVRYCLVHIYLIEKNYPVAISLCKEILAAPDLKQVNRTIMSEILADAEMIAQIPANLSSQLPPQTSVTSLRDAWEAENVEALKDQLGASLLQDSVVLFHVDSDGKHPFLSITVGNESTVDYRETLVSSCEAARLAHPDGSIVVLTDMVSNASYLPDWVRVLRVNTEASQMMYGRMRAYRALAMTRKLQGRALFLDTDVYLNRPFTPLFDGTFDIALTYRNDIYFWHMPINEGMILAADGQSNKLAQFFGESLVLYEWLAAQPAVPRRYGFDIKMWRGGQLSIGALVNWNVPPHAAADQEIRSVRYRFLPCSDFNCPAMDNDQQAFLEKKWAIHFKGNTAKAMMATYKKGELKRG